jgi:hypothetical protein
MARPIFLLSLPRSGSTLLQRLLLADGRCATLGEPSLLLRLLGGDDVVVRKATYWESLVTTSQRDIREAWDGFDDAWRQGVRGLMARIYDGLAGEKEWFLDKTPRYALIAEEIIRTFPDAGFLVLWRHPMAVAASVAYTFRKGRWCPDEYSIDLHAGLDRLHAFCTAHQKQICQVRYEDLVEDPGRELERIGEYLGWDGLAEAAGRELPGSAGGTHGDPTGVKKYATVSPKSRDAWVEQIDNWYRRAWARRYFGAERAEWLAGRGYELTDEILHAPWWRGRIWAGVLDWFSARRRIRRRLTHPRWPVRFARNFRRGHGFDVSFQ